MKNKFKKGDIVEFRGSNVPYIIPAKFGTKYKVIYTLGTRISIKIPNHSQVNFRAVDFVKVNTKIKLYKYLLL